jgi:hypothetical protein
LKKPFALALLFMLASAPVVATACELLCVPGDTPSPDHDCDTARRASSMGITIQNDRDASCRHVSSTPLPAALKKTTDSQRPATALDLTHHLPAERVSALLSSPLHDPTALEATALQIPLRI